MDFDIEKWSACIENTAIKIVVVCITIVALTWLFVW